MTPIDFLGVAAAAFFGTAAVVVMQILHDRKRERDFDAKNGQIALMRILDRFEWLCSLHKQSLLLDKSKPGRWHKMSPFYSPATPEPVDVASLAFLFGHCESNLHNQLLVEQGRFDVVVGVLKMRNDDHQEFQRRSAFLETQGVTSFKSEQEAELVIGKDLMARLRQVTDDLFEQAEKALVNTKKDFKMLRHELKKYFPKKKFLEVTKWPDEDIGGHDG